MAQKTQTGAKAAVGLAAMAAAAGAYYFYGSKHATQHRRKMKSWAIKARGEVVEKLEKAQELTQKKYDRVVDEVADKYRRVKNIDPKEVTALAEDMRRHWKNISSQVQSRPKKRIRPKRVK